MNHIFRNWLSELPFLVVCHKGQLAYIIWRNTQSPLMIPKCDSNVKLRLGFPHCIVAETLRVIFLAIHLPFKPCSHALWKRVMRCARLRNSTRFGLCFPREYFLFELSVAFSLANFWNLYSHYLITWKHQVDHNIPFTVPSSSSSIA